MPLLLLFPYRFGYGSVSFPIKPCLYAKDIFVAALGIDDMIIVKTDDVLLVCPRRRVQDIRELVAELKRRGFGCYT